MSLVRSGSLTGLSLWRGATVLFLLIGLWGAGGGAASAQRFLHDDPLWTDPDRLDMPFPEPRSAPGRIDPVEFLGRTFGGPGESWGPAQNVNTVQGVPNSSWYTNRHYRFPMSKAELRRGPNEERRPVGAWTVVGFGPGDGVPQAVIRDSTGRRFTIRFDARSHPEMATGAAMIGSRLLHALGYNVPQHWLTYVQADRLVAGPDTIVTQADVDSLLALTARRPAHSLSPDSAYRALVTRIPEVERRIGPFRFRGTRPDDGNDVFPHEDRRELRGLRVIAAWIHHANIRSRHTLDVGVRLGGRRFVRHYLTNLHETLGSDGAVRTPPWAGHEHVLELTQVVKRMSTLGLRGGEWAETDVPSWPALGHFTAEHFEPTRWRPKWPNPAFQRCTAADAFWAAKKVRHFSKEDLEAIVRTADYSSPQVANYVLQTLLLRRDAIAQAYLHWGGGLDRFAVRDGQLTFQDLRATYGLAPDSLRRTVTWHVYSNRRDTVKKRLARRQSSTESLSVPRSHAPFLRVSLRTAGTGTTRVFLRRTEVLASLTRPQKGYEVVGIERVGPISSAP